MKGVYTITKFKGTLVNGEWVKGDVVEVIDDLENIITPWLGSQLRTGDVQGRTTTQTVVKVSEAVFNGAHCVEGADAVYSIAASVGPANATYTAPAGMDDGFWEIESTLNPPASVTRQIRTVYLSSVYGGAVDDCYSVVTLTTPCPQTTTEILQINYKLILDATTLTAEGTRSNSANDIFFADMFVNSTPPYWNDTVYVMSYDDAVWGTGMKAGAPCRDANGATNEMFHGTVDVQEGNVSTADSLPKQGIVTATFGGQFGTSNVSTSSTEWCGWPVKGIGIGAEHGIYAVTGINKGTDSSIQNTFGRAADVGSARSPFLDTGVIATSAASVVPVDKGDWVEHINDSYTMPYLYRITMETGGIVGSSTYKIKRRKLGRWNNNHVNWHPRGIPLGQMEPSPDKTVQVHMDKTTVAVARHGQIVYSNVGAGGSTADSFMNNPGASGGFTGYFTQRYCFPEFITFDYTGITISDINHLHVNLNSTTTPALSVTEALQVETDGSDIYIADAGTGLFKIERNIGDFTEGNFTITQQSPPGITDATSCRGVVSKGGGNKGAPGKIVEIRILRGGSNYAVADTVTIVGGMGTGALAEVNTVDGDGAITSIRITNKGSDYIEDNVQAYVSSTTGGVGASLDPLIGSGGDIWALFDDTTDAVMYLAHTTRLTSDHTNLAFDSTGPETITRTGGASDFLAEGFLVGQKLIIKNAEDAGNDGTFTITAVTATVITVAENLFTNATDTTAQIEGVNWEVMRSTITTTETLTYVANGTGVGDTITGSGTSFITQGFVEGMKIVISSSASNDGIYTIADVTATVITLVTEDVLVAEGPLSDTMAALTDFTITNYTSGTPGRTGFIGLNMDTEHADDRFAMCTPVVKRANDGISVLNTGDGGWDWWSHANSTGTTTAGTTDRIRLGSNIDNQASAVEQFGPMSFGPMTEANLWASCGESDIDAGYSTWGSATATVSRTSGQMRQYGPLRNVSDEITIPCVGTANNQQFRTCSTVAQMNTASTSDTILLYDFGAEDTTDFSPGGIWRKGFSLGYLGKGMFWGLTQDITPDPSGFYIFTANGNGTQAVEDAMPYGFWEDYGWDGNDWVLGNASAKTTHAQVSFSGTGIDITAATGAIVGAGFASTDWAGDGFLAGDTITIATSEDPSNNGSYIIESLSGTTLTVTPQKLPAVDTTTPDDTTATVVGDHAIIDGLGLSFDDSGGANALVVDEYYDFHVFDGILNDNATNFSLNSRWTWAADAIGTDFSAGGSPSSTIPSSNLGAVTNVPLGSLYWEGGSTNSFNAYVEPGVAGTTNINISQGTTFAHEITQSTDFVLRFKAAGCYTSGLGHDLHMGLVPWTTITDGSRSIAISELDENITIEYDATNFPEIDQYTIRVRNTGNGADQLVYSADRVQVVVGQDELLFDGVTGGEGQFIDGTGHAASDIITMDDGSTVTVNTVSSGQITEFTVTTASLISSGRTERIIGSNDYTDLTFSTGPDEITRSTGEPFDTDGFLVGMKVIVDNSGGTNNGVFTITGVSATVLSIEETLGAETVLPAYFGTGLYQTATDGSGVDFAITLGTTNETAVDALIGGKDEHSMHRIGTAAGNTTWRLNGVVYYTYAGALHTATDMGVCFHPDNDGWQNIYDASIDHVVDRRIMRVGNGTTTGSDDPNFRCLPSLLGGSDGLRLYYDSGSGPTEFVYVTDGYTAPAANEVSIIPFSGDLWFNSANDGDTITGNWTITKRNNLT